MMLAVLIITSHIHNKYTDDHISYPIYIYIYIYIYNCGWIQSAEVFPDLICVVRKVKNSTVGLEGGYNSEMFS